MLHVMVRAMALLAAFLSAGALLAFSGKAGEFGSRTYAFLHKRLSERRGGVLDYERIASFLQKNDAGQVIGALARPVPYMGLCIVSGAVGALAGSFVHPGLSAVLIPIGVALPGTLIRLHNQEENRKILGEIKLVYYFISVQTGAGVYLGGCLVECHQAVENRRLKAALVKLSNEIALRCDVGRALDGFAASFDNTYLDTLCIIIKQAFESGQAIELLQDISEQLKEVEENLLYQKREQLSRKIALFELLFFVGTVAGILYACANEMFQSMLHF